MQVQAYNLLDKIYWARGVESSGSLGEGFNYGRTLKLFFKLNF